MTNSKYDGIKKKQLTSLLILIVIVPFLLFGSLPATSQMISYGYDIFFITILGIVLNWGIFEISSFVVDKKEKPNEWFILFLFASIFGSILFFFPTIQLIQQTPPTTTDEAKFLLESFNWTLFFGIFSVGIILFLLITTLLDVEFKDQSILLLVTILLTLCFISIVFLAKFFSYLILFLPILICTFSDTFAYLGGKIFGKTKMVPNISPNKTIEGFYIGTIAAIIFSLFWYFLLIYPTWTTATPLVETIFSGWEVLLLIFVLILIAPFGDLLFSKIKRNYSKKDFGTFLPGHGGLLDRIDSHVVTTILCSTIAIVMVVV